MNIKYAIRKIVNKTILFLFCVGFLFVISKNIFEKKSSYDSEFRSNFKNKYLLTDIDKFTCPNDFVDTSSKLGDNSTKLLKYFWCINEKIAIFLGAEKTGKIILIEFSILDRKSKCSSQNLANIFEVDENLIVDESNIDILGANYTYSLPENKFENNGLIAKVATHMYFCKEADKGRFVELYTAEDIENKP